MARSHTQDRKARVTADRTKVQLRKAPGKVAVGGTTAGVIAPVFIPNRNRIGWSTLECRLGSLH